MHYVTPSLCSFTVSCSFEYVEAVKACFTLPLSLTHLALQRPHYHTYLLAAYPKVRQPTSAEDVEAVPYTHPARHIKAWVVEEEEEETFLWSLVKYISVHTYLHKHTHTIINIHKYQAED